MEENNAIDLEHHFGALFHLKLHCCHADVEEWTQFRMNMGVYYRCLEHKNTRKAYFI